MQKHELNNKESKSDESKAAEEVTIAKDAVLNKEVVSELPKSDEKAANL